MWLIDLFHVSTPNDLCDFRVERILEFLIPFGRGPTPTRYRMYGSMVLYVVRCCRDIDEWSVGRPYVLFLPILLRLLFAGAM
jgi:hypothetical protein